MTLPRPRAVLIDVGFTLSAFDGQRIATLAGDVGVVVDGAAVNACEAAIRREMSQAAWSFSPQGEGARRGQLFYQRLLQLAGAVAAPSRMERAGAHIWDAHLKNSVWTRVLPGVREALDGLSRADMKLVVVSNSEGNMEPLLRDIGLFHHFVAVLDSTVVGIAKPDPRIFHMALAAVGATPDEAIMVGDSLVADVQGAQRVGIAASLLDPFDLYPGVNVTRHQGFASFVSWLLAPPAA